MLALNNPWLKTLLFQQHVRTDLNWRAVAMQINRSLYTRAGLGRPGSDLHSVHSFKPSRKKILWANVFDSAIQLRNQPTVPGGWSVLIQNLGRFNKKDCRRPCAGYLCLFFHLSLSEIWLSFISPAWRPQRPVQSHDSGAAAAQRRRGFSSGQPPFSHRIPPPPPPLLYGTAGRSSPTTAAGC